MTAAADAHGWPSLCAYKLQVLNASLFVRPKKSTAKHLQFCTWSTTRVGKTNRGNKYQAPKPDNAWNTSTASLPPKKHLRCDVLDQSQVHPHWAQTIYLLYWSFMYFPKRLLLWFLGVRALPKASSSGLELNIRFSIMFSMLPCNSTSESQPVEEEWSIPTTARYRMRQHTVHVCEDSADLRITVKCWASDGTQCYISKASHSWRLSLRWQQKTGQANVHYTGTSSVTINHSFLECFKKGDKKFTWTWIGSTANQMSICLFKALHQRKNAQKTCIFS